MSGRIFMAIGVMVVDNYRKNGFSIASQKTEQIDPLTLICCYTMDLNDIKIEHVPLDSP